MPVHLVHERGELLLVSGGPSTKDLAGAVEGKHMSYLSMDLSTGLSPPGSVGPRFPPRAVKLRSMLSSPSQSRETFYRQEERRSQKH